MRFFASSSYLYQYEHHFQISFSVHPVTPGLKSAFQLLRSFFNPTPPFIASLYRTKMPTSLGCHWFDSGRAGVAVPKTVVCSMLLCSSSAVERVIRITVIIARTVGGCLYRLTKCSTRGQMPVPVCSAVGEAMNRAHLNV